MHCNNCNELLREDEEQWAFDYPYCEDCFNEAFTYCSDCDSIISRRDAYYNGNGETYCEYCYDDIEVDEDCPDNPDVDSADRELIVNLSRNWLNDKVDYRRTIYINAKDECLRTIKEKTGFVDRPIYVFGLKDRDEYQISASDDIYDAALTYITENQLNIVVSATTGCGRIGFSLSLRKNNQPEIIKLIKELTTIKQEQLLCAE